jgi:hypothetical protein
VDGVLWVVARLWKLVLRVGFHRRGDR